MQFDPNSNTYDGPGGQDGPLLPVGGPYHGVIEWASVRPAPKGPRILVRIRAWYDGATRQCHEYAPIFEGYAARGDAKAMSYTATLCRMAGVQRAFDSENEADVKAVLENSIVAFSVKHEEYAGKLRAKIASWSEKTQAIVDMMTGGRDDDIPFEQRP